MKKLVVDEKNDGKMLVSFLLSKYMNLKKSSIYKALRKKDIIVNGKRINENTILHKGDNITIYITDKELFGELNIVYEDDNILVINKPNNISVTESKLDEITLSDLVSNYCTGAMPCHRLDRNTEGLILFAKNKESLDILLEKFKTREIEKYYSALVYGTFENKKDTLKSYLFKDNKNAKVYVYDNQVEGSSLIITSYEVIKENTEQNVSLLDIHLETGKTHQIRAHLSHIGHPLIGDRKIWYI